jgi:hypothetical protein
VRVYRAGLPALLPLLPGLVVFPSLLLAGALLPALLIGALLPALLIGALASRLLRLVTLASLLLTALLIAILLHWKSPLIWKL